MQRGEPIAQSAVNVIRFSFSFTSIFSCICRMTMFVSGSSNLPLTFVSEIVRFVIYIHVIFIGNGIFAVSIFKSGQVFNNFYLGLVFIWVTFHVTLFNFETYQFHDSPCHFFATATTTDVSAAATEIVKDFHNYAIKIVIIIIIIKVIIIIIGRLSLYIYRIEKKE